MTQRSPLKRVASVVAGTLAVAFVCFSVFFARWNSEGPSMWPGLYETRFITLRAAFGSPRRGDLVVFRLPDGELTAVKRVVGLPGDTVEILDGRVFVGGQPLGDEADVPCPPSPEWIGPDVLCRLESAGDRRWRAARDAEGGFSELNFGPVVVPEGAYFVIGDMRTQSNDSRSLGSVPLARIEGRVVWGEAAVP